MYGLGNDFIVLDARADPEISSAAEPKRATRLTDRKMGIVSYADQLSTYCLVTLTHFLRLRSLKLRVSILVIVMQTSQKATEYVAHCMEEYSFSDTVGPCIQAPNPWHLFRRFMIVLLQKPEFLITPCEQGCDQLIILEKSTEAHCRMRIINADGSEVGACGNATRCIGGLLFEETPSLEEATIQTKAGILRCYKVSLRFLHSRPC